MNVQVIETGNRPSVWTKARRFAPAGARVFGELLGAMDFADFAIIVLDWENKTGRLPQEIARPILYVQVHKVFPDYENHNHLTVESRVEVDEVFGDDAVTANIILDLAHELQEKVEDSTKRRAKWD